MGLRSALLSAALTLTCGSAVHAADITWQVAYPAPGGHYRGVTAVSPADAWATGFTAGPAPLLQHWDGTHWTDFPPPVGDRCGDPGESCVADGIDASSASNAFAVVRDGSHQVGTLVWHWDGNHWDDLPTPDPPTQSFAFFASPSVKAFSATDAWLIGFASLPTGELTTAAVHWDGLRWTRFPTPEPGVHQNVLQAVAGTAPDDVWAGGYWTTGSGHHSVSHSLLLHFDGHAWTQSPAPDSATGSSPVTAVVALSRTDAWAGTVDGAMLHWDGTAWTVAATGIPTRSMTALSARDIWAAPDSGDVVHHFDGTAWSAVTLPLVAPTAGRVTPLAPPVPAHYQLAAAASAGPGTVWFVGDYVPPSTEGQAVVVSTGTG